MKKPKPLSLARAIVQIAAFIFLPALYVLAINEIKQVFQSIINHSFTGSEVASVLLAIGLIIVTALTGRFFCGWICSFGAFTDLIYNLRRKLWKKNFRIGEKADFWLKWLKYIILFGLLILVWSLGLKSFNALSAWDSFGLLFSFGKAPALTTVLANMAVSLLVLIAVTVLSAMFERFFCRYLCPLGALLAVTSKIRILRLAKPREQCGKCRACTSACAMGIPLYKTDSIGSGECIQCMKCVSACPRKNISLQVGEMNVKPLVTGVAAAATIAGIYYIGNFAVNLQASNPAAVVQTETSPSNAASSVYSLSNQSNANQAATQTVVTQLVATSEQTSTSSVPSSSSLYKDGTYQGSGFGFRGQTTVSVTVSGGKITDVTIVSYNDDAPYFNRASTMICDEVVSGQSAQVNAVSGATYSSEGIMSAVADALSKAQ